MTDHDQNHRSSLIVLGILVLCVIAMCSGCSTAPVIPKLAQPSSVMMQKCPQLQKLNDDAKLSDVANTVNVNYATYYECAVKSDAWIEWYQIQKQMFEELKR